jgi:peptidoglycan/LPS O-acetylase OafA/YrhL
MPRRRLISTIALIGFACYAVVVVVISVASGPGHGSVYWVSIGAIVLLALAALWLSSRIRRRRRGALD